MYAVSLLQCPVGDAVAEHFSGDFETMVPGGLALMAGLSKGTTFNADDRKQ